MRGNIYVYIPSALEGMDITLPVKGLEKVLLQFKNWVGEHDALDPNAEVFITVWGPGLKWRYTSESSVAGFADDIEDAARVITVLMAAR